MGILVAAVAVALGQLAAAFVDGAASPIVAVGQAVIDAAPQWLKSFAISTFGSGDKIALLVGILLVLALGAAALGRLALRHRRLGHAAVAVLGAVGIAAALTRPGADASWAVPSIVAALAAAGAFTLLTRAAGEEPRRAQPGGHDARAEYVRLNRRRFLKAALAVGATATAAGGLGKLFGARSSVAASRAAVRIPTPASLARPLPAGAELHAPGLSPFFTPTAEFYRVDTALLVPQVDARTWKLRIHGMVDQEIQLDFEQLIARPLIERDITLNCVSNPVGGSYIGNARWIGAPLAPLLREAGVYQGADQIVGRSVDGMTIGTPTRIATDGRDAMLAVAMNGDPLPVEHGFPVRMLVPGLYGYESATKWLVDLELTTFDAYDPYWVSRGWARVAPIKTASRIDTPRPFAELGAGPIAVAGIAWAQHRGIERVEVRVDQGPWNEATLSVQNSLDTWRQWAWEWNATPGEHSIEVRATDGTGAVQTVEKAQPFPGGATGWHQVVVTVS